LCRALTCISPPARPSETRSPPQTTGAAEFRGLPSRAGLLRCPAATMASTRWPENWRSQRDGEAQSQQTDGLNTAPATTERFSRKRAALRCEDAAPLHRHSFTTGLNREAHFVATLSASPSCMWHRCDAPCAAHTAWRWREQRVARSLRPISPPSWFRSAIATCRNGRSVRRGKNSGLTAPRRGFTDRTVAPAHDCTPDFRPGGHPLAASRAGWRAAAGGTHAALRVSVLRRVLYALQFGWKPPLHAAVEPLDGGSTRSGEAAGVSR
jgi:hypothetical protein